MGSSEDLVHGLIVLMLIIVIILSRGIPYYENEVEVARCKEACAQRDLGNGHYQDGECWCQNVNVRSFIEARTGKVHK